MAKKKKASSTKGEWGIVRRTVKAPGKKQAAPHAPVADDRMSRTAPKSVAPQQQQTDWPVLPSTPFKAPSRPQAKRETGPVVATLVSEKVQAIVERGYLEQSGSRVHPLGCPYNCEPVWIGEVPYHFFGHECGEYRMCPWWSKEGKDQAPF